MIGKLVVSLMCFIVTIPASAQLCSKWEAPKQIGHLSPKEVREASGAAASLQFSNRIYWVNDSGDKGFLYYSESDGTNLHKVKIAKFKPRDTEALALTDCPEGSCLAIADIGDNRSKRKDIEIAFVPEQRNYANTVSILRRLKLVYPDGAHDAEGMAFLPSGDLLIITKAIFVSRFASGSAGVYTLTKPEWIKASQKSNPTTLRKLGELPLPTWLAEDLFFGQVVTDMAVNTHRQVLGLLTYTRAVEIPLSKMKDLSTSKSWVKDKDFALVPLTALAQQETLVYLNHPDRLLWSTEYRMPEAPIFSMTCDHSHP